MVQLNCSGVAELLQVKQGSGPQNCVLSAVYLPSTGQIRHFWPRDGLLWSLKTRGGCAPGWDVPGILVGQKKIGHEMRQVFDGRIQVNNFQSFEAVESFVSDFQMWGWWQQELRRNFRDLIPIVYLNDVMRGRFLVKFRRVFGPWMWGKCMGVWVKKQSDLCGE